MTKTIQIVLGLIVFAVLAPGPFSRYLEARGLGIQKIDTRDLDPFFDGLSGYVISTDRLKSHGHIRIMKKTTLVGPGPEDAVPADPWGSAIVRVNVENAPGLWKRRLTFEGRHLEIDDRIASGHRGRYPT